MNNSEKDYLNFAETKSEKPKNVATPPSIPAPSSPRLIALEKSSEHYKRKSVRYERDKPYDH
jgi:hypothetical protein